MKGRRIFCTGCMEKASAGETVQCKVPFVKQEYNIYIEFQTGVAVKYGKVRTQSAAVFWGKFGYNSVSRRGVHGVQQRVCAQGAGRRILERIGWECKQQHGVPMKGCRPCPPVTTSCHKEAQEPWKGVFYNEVKEGRRGTGNRSRCGTHNVAGRWGVEPVAVHREVQFQEGKWSHQSLSHRPHNGEGVGEGEEGEGRENGLPPQGRTCSMEAMFAWLNVHSEEPEKGVVVGYCRAGTGRMRVGSACSYACRVKGHGQ